MVEVQLSSLLHFHLFAWLGSARCISILSREILVKKKGGGGGGGGALPKSSEMASAKGDVTLLWYFGQEVQDRCSRPFIINMHLPNNH